MSFNFNNKNIAFLVGHKTNKLPWRDDEYNILCVDLKAECKSILDKVIDMGDINVFLTGMEDGFSRIATEILVEMKQMYNHIKIIPVFNDEPDVSNLSLEQQIKFWRILANCEERIILNDDFSTCNIDKNIYMAKKSKVCIACWNGRPSTTANAIKYVIENNCFVKIIDLNYYQP